MNAWRVAVGVFAVTLVLTAIGASWASTRQQSESVSATHPENTTTISERPTPSNTKPTPSLPAEDVPGKDIRDLPRYPGSVRVEYIRQEQNPFVFTRLRYLSLAKLDIIRGYYRVAFRSKNWMVANAEFSEGEWAFLVVYGEREAQVKIEPHSRGVTRLDAVLSKTFPEKKPALKEIPRSEPRYAAALLSAILSIRDTDTRWHLSADSRREPTLRFAVSY